MKPLVLTRGAVSRIALLAWIPLLLAIISVASPVHAQSGDWAIDRIAIDYAITANGDVQAVETITVDFRDLPSRGIFRELRVRGACPAPDPDAPPVFACPSGHDRIWRYEDLAVSYGDGRAVPWQTSEDGQFLVVRIGDPDVFLTGRHVYRIEYRLVGALDAYAGHDEFNWDAVSGWDTTVLDVDISVTLPEQTDLRGACFFGAFGSTETCTATPGADSVRFVAPRPLFAGAYMTIVAGWPQGIVTVAPPITEDRVSIDDFFAFDPAEWLGAGATAFLGLAGVATAWWKRGRDRRYRTIHYLGGNDATETTPLFADARVVVEYLPPEGLRPAQMGLILDERADTLDVTATIIDLAVRGYLHIDEIPKEGWFGKADWKLRRLEPAQNDLLAYERRLLNALFSGGKTEVLISDLKDKFATNLQKVKKDLYDDARDRAWFSGNPSTVKAQWAGIAVGVVLAGAAAAAISGWFFGRALVGVPLAGAGIVMLALAPSMSRRTATGSEAHRRVLGFREYIVTAETHRQEFNEQQNIFARYLPFAIVFECVERWAKAFEGIEGLEANAQASMASWYTGASLLSLSNISSSLGTISSSFSSTIASTPSSSGSSGFSGGSAGGGGGGGGGGRW